MINLDGPWHEQTSMFPKGEPMQGLELSPFETAEGDIFVLDRPASSPWMWESWALPYSKGSAFGPATRGPFPLYACCECSGQTLSLPVLPLIFARVADRRRHDHDGERRAAHLREVRRASAWPGSLSAPDSPPTLAARCAGTRRSVASSPST